MHARPRPNATPIAGVLLILMLIVFAAQTSHGIPVAMARRSAYPPGVLCVEQQLVIVRVTPSGLFLHQEPVERDRLAARLHELFRTRFERVAYVYGEPGVRFGDVVGVIDVMSPVVPTIGLLTAKSKPTARDPLMWVAGPVRER